MMGFSSSIKSLQTPTNRQTSTSAGAAAAPIPNWCGWPSRCMCGMCGAVLCYLKARGLVLPSPSTRDSVMSMLSERIMGTTCLNSEERDGEPTICTSTTSSSSKTNTLQPHSSADRALRLCHKAEVSSLFMGL